MLGCVASHLSLFSLLQKNHEKKTKQKLVSLFSLFSRSLPPSLRLSLSLPTATFSSKVAIVEHAPLVGGLVEVKVPGSPRSGAAAPSSSSAPAATPAAAARCCALPNQCSGSFWVSAHSMTSRLSPMTSPLGSCNTGTVPLGEAAIKALGLALSSTSRSCTRAPLIHSAIRARIA